MSNFIPLLNKQLIKNSNINLNELGISTGFLGLGRKIYLVYDERQGGWGVESLNLIQRILRFVFGLYGHTHKETIRPLLLSNQSLLLQESIQYSSLFERIQHVWNVSLVQESHRFCSPSQITYDKTINRFYGRASQAERLMIQYREALVPRDLKNFQRVCLFGNWKEMDVNIDAPLVRDGREFKLFELIATELPELGNYAFVNIRGNGECGYRTIVSGLIHNDCIFHNRIDELQCSLQRAFNNLINSWNALPFDETETTFFETSKNASLIQLDRMKEMTILQRIALLQEEEFLAPFLSFIRCITVSQTKLIQDEDLEEQVIRNRDRTNEILAALRQKTIGESELLSYAIKNYPLNSLLSHTVLPDIPGNACQNAKKEQLQLLVQQAYKVNSNLLTELEKLVSEGDALSNKQNILAAPLTESSELRLSTEEFLRQKALGNANSPRPFWALGTDFIAIGYALNKNLCCIYRDQFKDLAFGIQKTFSNYPADFYGLNMTGEVHYNALLPII